MTTSLAHSAPSPALSAARVQDPWTATLGMVLFIGSWLMMFAALFFVYTGMRLGEAVWPPVEYPPLPTAQALVNTIAVLLSSVCMWRAQRSAPVGPELSATQTFSKATKRWLLATTLLGALFLGLQWRMWNGLHQDGFYLQSGGYGASFFGLTYIHAAHVAVGVLGLGWQWIRLWLGRGSNLSIRLWGMYWHFVGALWLALLISVFLI